MKIVLDTNAYSDYAEGLPTAVDALTTYGDRIYLPTTVVGELHFGFLKGNRREFNEKMLRRFIDALQVELIDVTMDVARKYGIIYLSLIKKGKKIPINDVWIAACCMEVGGTLLTSDKHFMDVDQIDTILLPQ